jgi:hypothetical protein
MLVTFREHAAPDLCIFHTSVTSAGVRLDGAGLIDCEGISALFASRYECLTTLRYLKC